MHLLIGDMVYKRDSTRESLKTHVILIDFQVINFCLSILYRGGKMSGLFISQLCAYYTHIHILYGASEALSREREKNYPLNKCVINNAYLAAQV